MILSVVAFCALLQPSDAKGVSTSGPDNEVAIVRASVTLKCSSGINGCSSVEWLKTDSSSNSTTIFRSYSGISESFRWRYEVDETEGCDLIISKLTMSDAGLFVCRIANVDSLSASLIVLESTPTCERLKLSRRLGNSDELTYHCSLNYAGLVDKATMIWLYTSNGTQVERVPPQQETGGTISRSFSMSVEQLSEDQSFRCVTRFRVPAERSRASNVPEAKCETPQRGVERFPRADRSSNDPTYEENEEKKSPITYIVVGVVFLVLAIAALVFCLACGGMNCLCCSN